MKRWERAINHKWQAETHHAFLLYLLVDDLILNGAKGGDQFETVPEYLMTASVMGDAKFVAAFNRGTGIEFRNEVMENEFLKFLAGLYPESNVAQQNVAVLEFKRRRNDLAYALSLFSEMLRISRTDERANVKRGLDEIFPEGADREAGKPFFGVIIEYLETIAPQDAATGIEIDRNALVTFLAWAKDTKMAKARNLFALTAESLASVAPQLAAETSGIVPIKIHFPDDEDLRRTIEAVRGQCPPHKDDVETGRLVHLSRGLSRKTLVGMIREAHTRCAALTADAVFTIKKKFLEERSGGHIELLEHPRSIESIGGLAAYRAYIMKVVKAMREGDVLLVPQGIMLIGAPGTGKTVFAEAVAHEAGIPFVRLKNIRNMWVGSSERTLELVLELLQALAPVVVFVDEIDQEYQSRSVMADNTGVNNRLQGRLFQFMSNTDLRGKVLWIAASNRPDILDTAMIREGRFDRRLAFFPPHADDRAEILIAILRNMERLAPKDKEFRWKIRDGFAKEFGWFAHRHRKQDTGLERCEPDMHRRGTQAEDELDLTGGQIESIVQKAYELAGGHPNVVGEEHLLQALNDYIPGQDFLQHGRMTDLALLYCNEESVIPEGKWRKRLKFLRVQESAGTTLRIT